MFFVCIVFFMFLAAVILSPKMRPANAFMLNESEKADIHRLVTAMQGAGLRYFLRLCCLSRRILNHLARCSYRMERSFGVGRDGSQQGMMIYLLDPPIQQLVRHFYCQLLFNVYFFPSSH
jgi:hypothetical protein